MAIGSGLAAQLGLAEEAYVNEVQQFNITGAPTGGTFKLTFDGAQTAAIAWNANAAAVQTALTALPNIGSGGVSCGGGPLPGTAVTVTYSGPLVSGRNVPQLTADITGLTGGAPVFNPSTTTPGTGYGDAVTVTRFLEFVSETVQYQIDRIESSALRTGNRLLRTDRWAANKKGAAGDLQLEVATTGFGLLFKHMFGSSIITTPTNGVLTRDHTYSLADPTGKSLTVQLGTPDAYGTVRALTYKGCKINGWELSNAVDGLLDMKVTLDAQDEDQTIALAAASYPAAQNLFDFTEGVITVAGANFAVSNVTLTMDPAINTSRYFIRGLPLKKEPVPNAMIAFSGTLTAEFTDLSAYNRFVNGTLAAVTMTWTGPQIEAVTPTYFYQVSITLPQVRFDGQSPDIAGPDVVQQSLPFVVLWDGTTSPSLVYRTTDTTD